MYKLLSLMVLFLFFSFSIAFFSTGCGDSSVSPQTSSPGNTFTDITKAPLHDPPLKIVRAEEGGGGLFSSVLDLITDGLKEGITDWIGENTTGRILDIIGNKMGISGSDSELDEINEKMVQLQDQLTSIQNQLTSLQNQLTIQGVTLENYISNTSLNTYITEIKAKFDTTDDSGLMYYSTQGSLLEPNDPDYSTDLALLRSYEATYVSSNTGVLEKDIQGIHDAICPGGSSPLNGVLKDYANNILLNPSSPNPNLSDPNNAMAAYSVLETYFAQILNYQTKACIIITEINNYKDPNGNANLASSYLNGTYKTLLKDEIVQYLQTVNYLMVNLADYRGDPNSYINDTQYISHGIARDNTYLMVLARSRFFCAQIMNTFENDNGLYGAIVTPYDYSPGTNSPVTQITLQFSGPTSFTTTVKAQNIQGRFPYTKWNTATAHSSPDNNWSFYDLSTLQNPNTNSYFDPNLPAGTYNITLIDNGNTDIPWRHQATNFGQVSIGYYDPNNPMSPPTNSPTDTNTMKFGCFSGRWNWGFSRINSSFMNVWVVPPKNTLTLPQASNLPPYMPYSNVTWPNPTLNNLGNGSSYSPTSSTAGVINQFSMVMPSSSNNARTLAYTIKLPIIVDPAPGDGNIASAKIYYNNSVSASYSASEAKASSMTEYNMALLDTNTKDSVYMAQYNNSNDQSTSHSVNITNKLYQGILNFNITEGRTYDINMNGCLYCEPYNKSTSSGNISMSWYIQVVYTNTYNIFN